MTTYTFTNLPNPSTGTKSIAATAINDSGQVIGTYYDSTSSYNFLYSNGSFTTLTSGTPPRGRNLQVQ